MSYRYAIRPDPPTAGILRLCWSNPWHRARLNAVDMVTGTILAADPQGLIVDVGWKQDGLVSRADIEKMHMDVTDFKVGSDIDVAWCASAIMTAI